MSLPCPHCGSNLDLTPVDPEDIRELRESMGLTQQEFMERLGYESDSAWQICSKWERGHKRCTGLDAMMVRHFEAFASPPRGPESRVEEFLGTDEFRRIDGYSDYWLTEEGRVVSTKGSDPEFMCVGETSKGRYFTARTDGGRQRVYIDQMEGA